MARSAAPSLVPGCEVVVRGERWTVLSTTPYADCAAIRLQGCDRRNAHVRRTLLTPFDRPVPISRTVSARRVSRRRWWRRIRAAVQHQHTFADLDALSRASIILLPYQLEPALAARRYGYLRILIADEVGLGKTIQASVLIAQLAADESDLRVLIVCPAGLRTQWRSELADRFALDARVADVDWLQQASRDLPVGANAWSLPGIYITSIDLVKRPEVLRGLETLAWDIVIFDEAHTLSPATARLAAARTVADRSRRVVLLTATPPDGDPLHMSALEALGRAGPADHLAIFRRSRREVGLHEARRTCVFAIRLSAAERRMHRLLDAYTTLLWHERRPHAEARGPLLSVLLRKRALSCARSLCASLERRQSLLAGHVGTTTQLLLPLLVEEQADDDVDEAVLAAPGLNDVAQERRLIERLVDAAREASARESKIRRLRRFLDRAGEPAIVFTEYRDTLVHIASAFADRPPAQLHGALSPAERDRIRTSFAQKGTLLLATDAASEGLNLHQRCRLVIHFELPWNPMRLEQRIGRVDRLGQSRRVHEVLLVARHTAERTVLEPLVRRLRRSRAATGSSRCDSLTESAVASAILGGQRLVLSPAPVIPAAPSPTFREEAIAEVRRLTHARRHRATESRRIIFFGRARCRVVTVVARLTCESAGGRILATRVLPLRIDTSRGEFHLDARGAVQLARDLVSRWPELETDVLGCLPNWQGPLPDWHRILDTLEARERHVLRALRADAHLLVQGGLFDRRAELEAEARRHFASDADESSGSRLSRLAGERSVRTRVAILAVAPGCAPRS